MTENKDDMSKGIIYKPDIYKIGGGVNRNHKK